MQKGTGQFALKLPSDIDYRALSWMFNTLNSDDEFEQFFDALPSLCDSEAFDDPWRAFIKPNEKILSHALIGMMDRTLLSDLVPEEVKQRRIIISTKAIGATSLLGPWWTLRRVLFGDWHGFSRSIHFGLIVQGWKNISSPVTEFYAQYVVGVTLASVQKRDDHWFELASGQLNESKSLLRNYFAHDDSVLLANAIFIIWRTIQTFSGTEDRHRRDILETSSKTLESVCRFDIQYTLLEHQHQFCGLWNQLVDAAQNNTHSDTTSLYMLTLKSIRRLYTTLHEETISAPTAFSTTTDDRNRVLDDATSYPKCRINEHRHSTPIPELKLDGITRDTRSMDMIPAFVARPPTLSTPPYPYPRTSAATTPPFGSLPHPAPSGPHHRVVQGPPFPVPQPHYPGPYSHSAAPPSPSLSQMAPRSQSVFAAMDGRDPSPSHPASLGPHDSVVPGPPFLVPQLYYPQATPGPFDRGVPGPYSHSAAPPPPGISQLNHRDQYVSVAMGGIGPNPSHPAPPNPYHQVAPSSYPLALGPYYSGHASLHATRKSHARHRHHHHRRDAPANTAKANSQQDAYASSFTPGVTYGRRVDAPISKITNLSRAFGTFSLSGKRKVQKAQ
jgi:hypothetical protein